MRVTNYSFIVLLCLLLVSCGNPGDSSGPEPSGDTDTDTDTDSDSDTDTDTDSDVDTETEMPPDSHYNWHTFYNGEAYAMAAAADGGVVVVGRTSQSWQGPDGEEPLSEFVGYYDLVVLKVGQDGTHEWHTFLGDTGPEEGYSVVLDSEGNILVAGQCGLGFNGPAGETPIQPYTGDYDNFVIKLSGAGQHVWHTFYGADDSEDAASVALDGEGNVYLSGTSVSSWGGEGIPDPLNPHSSLEDSKDVYVVKMGAGGNHLWHTFFGGDGDEQLGGLAVDDQGTVYVTGESYNQTDQYWVGPAAQLPLNPEADSTDGFVLKLDTDGAYQWHTYFGGRQLDVPRGVAVDGDLGVFVTGTSDWPWNGPAAEVPLAAHTKTADAYLMRLGPDGAYLWHGFFGGSAKDEGLDIIEAASGGFLVSGTSEGSWDGPDGESALNGHAGQQDAFVMKVGASGAFKWHAFHGGEDDESGDAVVLTSDGNVRIAGAAYQSFDGPQGESPLNPHSGGQRDLFILAREDGDTSSDVDTDTDTDTDVDLDGWVCHPAYYGADDGCDCGCEKPDPDCDGGGCSPSGCYESGCNNCHFADGTNMPCVPSSSGNDCPTGPFEQGTYVGTVLCTTEAACGLPQQDGYLGAELTYDCPDAEDVCCVQFCES